MQLIPVKPEALTDHVCRELERAILTSEIQAGEKLPPERDLALSLGVSRPILHEALLILAHKGLVTLVPRVGTIVNDFREHGSLELLEALMIHGDRHVTPKLLDDIMKIRGLFEVDMARLAAIQRSDSDLQRIEAAYAAELRTAHDDPAALAAADFEFHLAIALASGNAVFPMLLNSSRGLYYAISARFYTDTSIISEVHRWHGNLVTAIKQKKEKLTVNLMRNMLSHGEGWLQFNYTKEAKHG